MTGLATIFPRLAKAAPVRCGLGALLLATSCGAMAADDATENAGWWQRTTGAALAKAEKINAQGKTTLLLSGYSYHGRNTYTSERISEFNEKSWGAGIGKTLRHPNGNEEYLYGMAISDSHYDPQFMAGYAYQWVWPLAGPLEIGAGWTALLISRTDTWGGVPFPVALPLISLGTPDAKLMAAYIPRLSSNKGNGDVLYIFGRINFN
jgi:palmitoyl transferase